ncbi:MAG: Na+:solute symporter [Bacteroidales bacterium]|nr:MAG: Na+:solute symporter [Bacteroidales bacterium]
MDLGFTDWTIISLFVLITFLIGFRFKKSSSKSIHDFFLGGRNLPWYIAGLSMVATVFVIDGPAMITEIVSKKGISGNWIWWSLLIGGTFTTFFLANLWRRANVLTEFEFIELRYSGKVAAFLRGFKSLYFTLFLNILIIAWVSVAMINILRVFFNLPDLQLYIYLAIAMFIAAAYSVLSGLKGIAFINVFQFVITLAGSIVISAAILASYKISGISGLKIQLNEISADYLNYFPKITFSGGSSVPAFSISITALLAYLGIQWWASWTPQYEPGGGGYMAQRIMSTKSEKESIIATLFYQIVNYAIRPWPWIIVGLCIIILYPQTSDGDEKMNYYIAAGQYMPYGFSGLLIITLFGAYMSVISAQLNLGASFLANDVYKRFIVRKEKFKDDKRKNKHYVLISKLITILLMGISLYVATFFESITDIWEFLIACSSGLGLVLILRWFWWRINAWSEITAITVPFILVYIINLFADVEFPDNLFIITGGTTFATVLITYLTPADNKEVLEKFCQRIKPIGFWGKYSQFSPKYPVRYFLALFMSWISSIIMIYSFMFFVGKLIFGEYLPAFGWLLAAIIYFAFLRGAMKVIFSQGSG